MKAHIDAALREGFTEPIRDPLWGHIYLTPELDALTRSAAFMRLYRIAQLGPASLCYPGATHTRAAHSIGVYHLTRRIVTTLTGRGAADWLSPCGLRSMLCAALLHDCGHFPYAHSLKELPLASHEELGAALIASEPLRSLVGKTGADPDMTAAIVRGGAPAGDAELRFYRTLLSGALDPDKLDYLNRDARFCGVSYGAQDIDWIFSVLYPSAEHGIEIDARGITSVESLLFSKYLMYRSVYWHRSVRAATAMIKKAVYAGLRDGVLTAEDLYSLDDHELFSLLDEKRHPLFSLSGAVRQGRLYTALNEEPFDEARHVPIEDLERRGAAEAELAARLSRETGAAIEPHEIIIDVPERTTFETNLFVRGENRVFGESSSLFTADTVASFVKMLRVVRVYAGPAACAAFQSGNYDCNIFRTQ